MLKLYESSNTGGNQNVLYANEIDINLFDCYNCDNTTVPTSGDHSLSFEIAPFETIRLNIIPSSNLSVTFGYGTIEWSQTSTDEHQYALIGTAVMNFYGNSTSNHRFQESHIPINNGLPF